MGSKSSKLKTPPLHKAVAKRSLENMQSLLEKEPSIIDSVDRRGETALHWAIRNNFTEGISFLIKNNANINTKDNNGNTALHCAIVDCNKDLMETILKIGADVNSVDAMGMTPLHFATKENFNEGIDLLLERDVDVNAENNMKITPLVWLVKRGDAISVEKLLARGANVNYVDEHGESLLHYAVRYGSVSIVKMLLARGSKVNRSNIHGQTPLHLAAKSEIKETVEILLAEGADVNCKDNYGETPLILAVDVGCLSIVKLLLEEGAEVNAQNNLGQTPLYLAIYFMHDDDEEDEYSYDYYFNIVQELLFWGASLLIPLMNGLTPFQLASEETCRINALKTHALKLTCVNLPVYEHLAIDQGELESFKETCLRELEKLKSTKYGRQSLHNILTNYHNPTFVLNDTLAQVIHSPSLRTEFPIYASLLVATFTKAKTRQALLDSAQPSFADFLERNVEIILPDEILREILSYLVNEDLLTLINTLRIIHSNKEES
uniref:PRANC domain-containing protein n=1 Tax=Graphocephala atropunctata TaxID=36148 RepID=A0A1B6LKW5_9HEMI